MGVKKIVLTRNQETFHGKEEHEKNILILWRGVHDITPPPLYGEKQGVICSNMLESTPATIPLIKSSHKWTRILFIISNSKLGIWIFSHPTIEINSQSNFYDVLIIDHKSRIVSLFLL